MEESPEREFTTSSGSGRLKPDKMMVELTTLGEDMRMVVQDSSGQQYKILEEPSSEAESLHHVASGIATSLGLVSPEHTPSGTSAHSSVEAAKAIEADWATDS